jgi:hypothetical protein
MLLQKLAFGRVCLITVAVKGNVTAGDHDAATFARQGVIGKRRSGQRAQVHWRHPRVKDRFAGSLRKLPAPTLFRHKRRGARTQIVRQEDLFTRNNSAIGSGQRLQVLKFGANVDIEFELREVNNFTAPAASAEAKNLGLVIQGGSKHVFSNDGNNRPPFQSSK